MTKEEHERVKQSVNRLKKASKKVVTIPPEPIASSFKENGKRSGY